MSHISAEEEKLDVRIWNLRISTGSVRVDKVTVTPIWSGKAQRLLVRVNGELWGYVSPRTVIRRADCLSVPGLPFLRPLPPVPCFRGHPDVFTCPCVGMKPPDDSVIPTTHNGRNWRVFPRRIE